MKTTIELSNELLIQAKKIAAKRHTTLKSIMEHALRREIYESAVAPAEADLFTVNKYGFPILKRDASPKTRITSEKIYQLIEESEGIS